MEKKFKLGVVGAGFMASAIINGALNSGFLTPEQVIVSDLQTEKLYKLKERGLHITTYNSEILNNSEYVLFAVKPQSFANAVEGVNKENDYKIISIMAGTKKSKINSVFPNARIARCMPNTPCSVGSGAVGADVSEFCDKDAAFVKGLFSAFAEVVFVPEDKINVVTGISGSSPAYFYLFIKGLVDAGVKRGLTYEDARNLAVNTMIGSGKMIFENEGKTLDELISAVCSKGGTTIEAIKVYAEAGLSEISENAVAACVKRAEELENL